MKTFTGFCQATSGLGTIWIETFEARNIKSAVNKARKLCAEAWGYRPKEIHVLGVCAGNIEVLHWQDLNDN